MKLTRRQLNAVLNIQDVEVQEDLIVVRIVGRMHGRVILVAIRDGAVWDVSFEGPRWTIPAWCP